jgi:mRNA interferase RelE/StbE
MSWSGILAWRIEITATAKKQLARLDHQVQVSILRYLRERIATDEDPRRFGASLRRELANRWKYRVGPYRLICEIQDEKVLVLILLVGHRSRIYKGR